MISPYESCLWIIINIKDDEVVSVGHSLTVTFCVTGGGLVRGDGKNHNVVVVKQGRTENVSVTFVVVSRFLFITEWYQYSY